MPKRTGYLVLTKNSEIFVENKEDGLNNGSLDDTLPLEMATKEEISKMLQASENRATIRPKSFSGRISDNAHSFLSHFEDYSKLIDLSPEHKCITFSLLLSDLAHCWYKNLKDDEKNDYEKLKKKFEENYLGPTKNWLNVHELEERKLQTGENIETYIADVMGKTSKLGLSEAETMQYLRRGLSPHLRAELIEHKPSTLAETVERIYIADSALKLKQQTLQSIDTTNQLANITTTMHRMNRRIEDIAKNRDMAIVDQQMPEKTPNELSQKDVRRSNGNYNNPPPQSKPQPPRSGCYICGKAHMARECWYRHDQRNQYNQQRPTFRPNGRQRQWNGGEHQRRDLFRYPVAMQHSMVPHFMQQPVMQQPVMQQPTTQQPMMQPFFPEQQQMYNPQQNTQQNGSPQHWQTGQPQQKNSYAPRQ